MNNNKREHSIVIKPVNPRYISVDENIHQTLTLYALSLYMAFRYESDYRNEESAIKRSAKFMYTKAKISRPQYYRCLNELEGHGLVLRDKENILGELCVIHVARELGYFTRGVSDRDTGVSDMDTDQYSIPISSNINITTSVLDKNYADKGNSNQEIVEAYHEHLPELTKIKVIDRDLGNKISSMKKNWHKYQKDGKTFTLELFIDFLKFIKARHQWFLQPRTTESGNLRKNSLRNLIAEINLARFANGEFSAS